MKITRCTPPPVPQPPKTITLELSETEFSDLQTALSQYVKFEHLEHYIQTWRQRQSNGGTFDIKAVVQPILDYEVM